jgi:hypothetical protein
VAILIKKHHQLWATTRGPLRADLKQHTGSLKDHRWYSFTKVAYRVARHHCTSRKVMLQDGVITLKKAFGRMNERHVRSL